MKKMLCSLLTVLLLVSCFAGTVNAAERAMGKFDVTVKACKDGISNGGRGNGYD